MAALVTGLAFVALKPGVLSPTAALVTGLAFVALKPGGLFSKRKT